MVSRDRRSLTYIYHPELDRAKFVAERRTP
jgi:hypothetical protein